MVTVTVRGRRWLRSDRVNVRASPELKAPQEPRAGRSGAGRAPSQGQRLAAGRLMRAGPGLSHGGAGGTPTLHAHRFSQTSSWTPPPSLWPKLGGRVPHSHLSLV